MLLIYTIAFERQIAPKEEICLLFSLTSYGTISYCFSMDIVSLLNVTKVNKNVTFVYLVFSLIYVIN